ELARCSTLGDMPPASPDSDTRRREDGESSPRARPLFAGGGAASAAAARDGCRPAVAHRDAAVVTCIDSAVGRLARVLRRIALARAAVAVGVAVDAPALFRVARRVADLGARAVRVRLARPARA